MTDASKSRSEVVRSWLKLNKIFFETVAALMLSIMAVLVSFAQLRTASKQTDLSEIQTRIAQAQAAPRFEIIFQPVKNEETGFFDTRRLVIDNRGGAVRDFFAEAASFLDVDVSAGREGSGKLEISLSDYLNSQFVSANGTGTIATISSYQNNKLVSDFSAAIRVSSQERKWEYALASVRNYVRLSYVDILGVAQADYYIIPAVGGASLLPANEGAAIFKKWRDQPRERLGAINADQVLDRAKQAFIKQTNVEDLPKR